MNRQDVGFRATTLAWITAVFTCGSLFASEDALPPEPPAAAQPTSDDNSAVRESPQPSTDEIAAWIAELDSNRYLVRERATQQLLAAGRAAVEPLLAAAIGDRPEPADRAIWILRQLGESDDYEVAAAALNHLIAVERPPAVAEEAKLALNQLRERICQRKLAKLGGRLEISNEVTPDIVQVQFVHVVLSRDWKGTAKDLECLATLGDHGYFRLEGAAIGDAEVKLFESVDDLASLQLFRTSVTPTAVDAIKERQPQAIVYVRNQALLGIEGEKHPRGVLVKGVPQGTGAAAAGILPGDVIAKLSGKEVKDFDRLTVQIGQHEPGERVEVTLLRGDQVVTKQVTLGRWPDVP